MQIAIELPDDFVTLQNQTEMMVEIRTCYALWLYKQGRVTLSKAAQLIGVDIYRFMEICQQNQVPVIDVTREELLREMQGL